MKWSLFLCLCPLFLFSQTQIGNNINGNITQEQFGSSVSFAADGSTIAIGAIGALGSLSGGGGSVRVYRNEESMWVPLGNLISLEGSLEENGEFGFGYCTKLSKDGSILVVGSLLSVTHQSYSYKASVYENIDGTWTQIGNGLGPFGLGGFPHGNALGVNISLSSDGAIIALGVSSGSNLQPTFGYTSVYKNISGNWIQMGSNIEGEHLGDQSGVSVSFIR